MAGGDRRPALPARRNPSAPVPDRPARPPAVPVVPDADAPPRRRRAVFGAAAEADAQATRRRNGEDIREPRRSRRAHLPAPAAPSPARRSGAEVARLGTCRCGSAAYEACVAGCSLPTCAEHLLSRSSRLARPGPYQSEREHTAYLRGFRASAAPMCAWCRERAAEAAVAALPPVAPLPADTVQRLAVLVRHPHDYPNDAWGETLRRHGGPAGVARLLAPRVLACRPAVSFEGRRGEVLAGVSLGSAGANGTLQVVDRAGSVWAVQPLVTGLVRKRRAWSWERAPEEGVARLLPRLLELAAP